MKRASRVTRGELTIGHGRLLACAICRRIDLEHQFRVVALETRQVELRKLGRANLPRRNQASQPCDTSECEIVVGRP